MIVYDRSGRQVAIGDRVYDLADYPYEVSAIDDAGIWLRYLADVDLPAICVSRADFEDAYKAEIV